MKIELNIGRREITVAALLACTAILGYKVGAAHADGPPDADALTYSGVLEQANGALFTGSHSVQLLIWTDSAGTTSACSAPAPTTLDLGTTGHFQLTLSSACQTAFKNQKDLWTEVFVDGNSTGKSKVGAVPYALEAGAASNAKGVLASDVLHAVKAGPGAQRVMVPDDVVADMSDKQVRWQAGTDVVMTDPMGNVTINFQEAFPNGLISVTPVWGDTGCPYAIVTTGASLSSVSIKAASCPSAMVRVNFIALGY